ncbi:NAD-binding protein [Mycena indigotica]|uniref:NAD-binding protein n=1 Tax=Mycena indigotica TaxID=2126181 RepID=A0A8H6SLJ2_9AGAR|nr:NAD-binding protein [Mycena indigotica]KAF7301035.1 NAD-binding protein [Mycena indigotica]
MLISEDDPLDLHGKVALVTGGKPDTGIGYCRQLLSGSKHSMLAGLCGRSRAIKDGSVHWLKLDLSDPRLAVSAAKELMEKEDSERLDIIGALPYVSYSILARFRAESNRISALPKDGLLDIMVIKFSSGRLPCTLLAPPRAL